MTFTEIETDRTFRNRMPYELQTLLNNEIEISFQLIFRKTLSN